MNTSSRPLIAFRPLVIPPRSCSTSCGPKIEPGPGVVDVGLRDDVVLPATHDVKRTPARFLPPADRSAPVVTSAVARPDKGPDGSEQFGDMERLHEDGGAVGSAPGLLACHKDQTNLGEMPPQVTSEIDAVDAGKIEVQDGQVRNRRKVVENQRDCLSRVRGSLDPISLAAEDSIGQDSHGRLVVYNQNPDHSETDHSQPTPRVQAVGVSRLIPRWLARQRR